MGAIAWPDSVRAPDARAPSARGSDLLVVAALIAVAGGLLLGVRGKIGPDAFLALVGGRLVEDHGVPHHALTVYSAGRTWVDQQWLAHFIMYRLDRLGGLALVGVANVCMVMVATVGGVLAARRLGAPAPRILNVMALALACVLIRGTVRPQIYGYVPFVATVYLLARHGATGSNRTLWCLPVLVVWANLHGSAILGAGLIVLRGLVLAWERRLQLARSPSAWLLPGLLALAPGPLLLITPYGTSMVGYYGSTLFNSGLRRFVTEWMPVTVDPVLGVCCLLLSALVGWSLWNSRAQPVWWERLVLLVLFAGAVLAVRNLVWFGLASLVLVPRLLGPPTARARAAPPRPRFNRLILAAACVVLIAGVAVTAARPEPALVPAYPNAGLAVVRTELQQKPALRVFADDVYADWLMWHIPRLVGRVAYNASLELLTREQLDTIGRFKGLAGRDWQHAATGYGLLILDSRESRARARYYRTAPGARTLFDRDGLQIVRVSSS